MSKPLAYTYDADTHCPQCAIARFGAEPERDWPREDATDRDGNPVGAIWPWDEWHEDGPGRYTLTCGTCAAVLDSCDHGSGMDEREDECGCDSCMAVPEPVLPVGHPGPARGTDCYTSHPWGAQWDCGCDALPSGRT